MYENILLSSTKRRIFDPYLKLANLIYANEVMPN